MVGHIDRQGLRDDEASKSWNSSHPSRGPEGGSRSERFEEHGREWVILLLRGAVRRPGRAARHPAGATGGRRMENQRGASRRLAVREAQAWSTSGDKHHVWAGISGR